MRFDGLTIRPFSLVVQLINTGIGGATFLSVRAKIFNEMYLTPLIRATVRLLGMHEC